MDQSQICRKLIITLCINLITKNLIRMSQIHIKRRIEIPHPLILDRIRMFQRRLIPEQSLYGSFSKTGNIMRRNAGIIIIRARLPGLKVKPLSII